MRRFSYLSNPAFKIAFRQLIYPPSADFRINASRKFFTHYTLELQEKRPYFRGTAQRGRRIGQLLQQDVIGGGSGNMFDSEGYIDIN